MSRIERLLIANRGEIVVRIARTARRLGIATIAVHSDADRSGPHVAACDDSIAIGGEAAADSYLRIDRLLEAARLSGADAVHPGYGFLSENAEFARAVSAAGLVFVGPSPEAIAAMGDKASARRRVAAAGIEVVPGYDGDSQDFVALERAAARIGFPIMVKAAAGGGGRGMRVVRHEHELADACRVASAEAAKAFGDGRLILERAIVAPRHVEVQVLADAHGRVLHLGERDCSVQRRHQKLIEETPSPAVDAALRERMGATAIAVAREIGYVGAGTVEFLLDREGRHWFMEMNTRLQVEHPVTELVTGLDLVEWQLRIARGEALSLRQEEVAWRGHAIEARLCAESPADDFRPGSGRVVAWFPPQGMRCDHALASGVEVPPWYDSMVAKLVAHAPTRAEALAELAHGLDRTTLLGVSTNRAFAARLLRHPAFLEGTGVSTDFIPTHFPTADTRAAAPDDHLWAVAAWLSVAAAPEVAGTAPEWRHWSTAQPLPQPWRLRWLGPTALQPAGPPEAHGRVTLGREVAIVERGERRHEVRARAHPDPQAPRPHIEVDGSVVEVRYAWDGLTLWLQTRDADHAFACRRREPARPSQASGGPSRDVRASINGRVTEVVAAAGCEVTIGDRLIVLEAMKMEHEVRASRAGRIAEVDVRAGDQVAPGRRLLRYEGDA